MDGALFRSFWSPRSIWESILISSAAGCQQRRNSNHAETVLIAFLDEYDTMKRILCISLSHSLPTKMGNDIKSKTDKYINYGLFARWVRRDDEDVQDYDEMEGEITFTRNAAAIKKKSWNTTQKG